MEKQHFCIKTHNQEKKLALLTMVHSKNFTSSDFVSLKQDCGYIWKGKLEPWHIEGSFEENNKLIFFGPALDLEPLDLEYTADVKELKELSAFFNELKDMKHCRFTPKHFAKIRGGGFFLFPPKLMDEIIKLSPFGGYHELIRYCHPDLKGAVGLSYSLALLDFRRLFGFHPWIQQEEEPLDQEIRTRVIPDLKNVLNSSRETEMIYQGLQGNPPDLQRWMELEPQETQEIPESFLRSWDKSLLSFSRQRYFMKNKIKLILLTAATLMLIFFVSKRVQKILEPPFTIGLTQLEVVEQFYSALEQLDSETTGEMTIHRRNSDVLKDMDLVYTFEAMRTTRVGGEDAMSPEEWLDQGAPFITRNQSVLGYTELEITPLQTNQFEVSYLSWFPPSSEEDTAGVPVIIQRVDRVELAQKKDAWFISSVETLEKKPMGSP